MSKKKKKNRQLSESFTPPGPGATFRDARAPTAITPEERDFRKTCRRAGGITFLVTLLVYTLTLYPSVGGGDSGGLISAAATWGVAHPPGYPLWTMLGKLFTFLPFHSVAWRVNLFSAVADSAAAALVTIAVLRLTRSRPSAALAAGLFAFAPLTWHYAVRAEVFALNNFFVALLLLLLVRLNEEKTLARALPAAFVCGLGLSHHHTFLFYAAPSFIHILLQLRSTPVFSSGWKRLLRPALLLGAVAAAGLIPYVYLPLAASADPFASWGETHTWDGFWTHFLRKDYGTFRLWARDNGEFLYLKTLWAYFRALFEQGLIFGPLLAVVGVRAAWRNVSIGRWVRFSAFLYLCYVLVFMFLSQSDPSKELEYEILSRFWQQPNLLVWIWAGLGLKVLAERYRPAPAAVTALATLAVFAQLGIHYTSEDMHDNRTIADFGHALYGTLPPDSLMLSLGDLNTYSSLYLHECEGFRPDVRLVDRMLLGYTWEARLVRKRYPGIVLPGPKLYGNIGYSTTQLLDANFDRFPVYAAEMKEYDHEEDVKQKYRLWKTGFLFKVLRKTDPVDLARINELFRENEAVFAAMQPQPRKSDHFWERLVIRDYWNSRYISAFEFFRFAESSGHKGTMLLPEEVQSLRYAIAIWEDILKKHPSPEPFTWKNLGIAYKLLSGIEPAARESAIVNFKQFVKITPKTSPDYAPAVNDLTSLGASP